MDVSSNEYAFINAAVTELRERHARDISGMTDEITRLLAELEAAESRVRELEGKYSELMHQVHEKIDGLTWHQTALSRLRSWNEQSNEPIDAAIDAARGEK